MKRLFQVWEAFAAISICSIAIARTGSTRQCREFGTLLWIQLFWRQRGWHEQVELEVVSSNKNAIALYQKLGFQKYGTFPNNMRYSDGVRTVIG